MGTAILMSKKSGWKQEVVGYVREASAIVHYFSVLEVILLIYSLIYGQDTLGAIIVWLIVMMLSSVIAELLKSKLPTLLRIASVTQARA